jgi:5-methylthioadenosine/S-adenosylhomocysteine deaminase
MNTTEVALAIEARWVIPVIPHGLVLENSTVLVNDDGTILSIMPTVEARAAFQPARVIRLEHHALMPGLINLHTHAAMTLMRGIADDLPLMDWLQHHIWPAERAVVSPRFVRDGTLLAIAEMLAGGVTCFNDMYFYPDAAAEAVVQTGIRAHLGLVVMDFPSAYATDADDYLLKGLEARDGWRGNPLISSSLAPHAPYTMSDRSFEQVMTYAEQLGLGIHTHLHETRSELEQSIAQYGVRPIRRMADLGILGPGLVAAHAVHLNEAERAMLQAFGCHIAHCPTSNLKLGSGIANLPAMLEQGINVGLGTDGAASNNRLDMFAEIRMAALLAKGAGENAAVVPAVAALEMATINGARALGLEDKIGNIESGKLADLVAVDMDSAICSPCFDPISHLVYVAGREHVTHTWVAGELCYQEGIYAHIEPAELKEITTQWYPKLSPFRV